MLRVWPVLLVVVIPGLPGAAAAKESPFNVDFFCGWGGYYRPMEWTPVEIGIGSTLSEPFGGAVIMSAPQDGLNTLNVTHRFVLTPDLYLHLPLVTKFAFAADSCNVRLVEAGGERLGRPVWEEKYYLWGRSTQNRTLTAVTESDMLIGHIGGSRFGLLRLPTQSFCYSQKRQGKVYLGDKLPRMAPWDWTGFVSLDLLILYDPDWNEFNPRQLEAVAQWVSNGGKLLLIMGTHPLAATNPIAQVLPVEVGQIRQTVVDSALLAKWELVSGEDETVACWPLAQKPGALVCEVETGDANDCVFATGYAGFGRAGVLAFDPSTLTEKHRLNSSQFWIGRIRAVLGDSGNPQADTTSKPRTSPYEVSVVESFRTIIFVGDANSTASNQNTDYYEIGLAQAASNAVMDYLYKGIRPLSIWWVILLLSVLAVLLGPVDYIVLKRKDRLPLTWVTCAFWIVVFTVGAYYGVQFLRSGDLELRVVSVLDGIEDRGPVWSTDYCGLFAPRSAEYRLKDLSESQWWSGIAPTQESIWSYQRESSARRIYCRQEDGENWPTSLPVNIWTIQCLLNESVAERLPFTADVQPRGDEIVVTISNQSDAPILNGYVLLGDKGGIRLDGVGPHAGREFRGSLGRLDAWQSYDTQRLRSSYSGRGPSRDSQAFKREDAFFAQGCLQRTRAIDAYLARGAAVVCVEYKQAPLSFGVDARFCRYDHIQLARLVVFPKEDDREPGNDKNSESQ